MYPCYLGLKVTPPSSFDDVVEVKKKRGHDRTAISEAKTDEEIIREHIAAKKTKGDKKETKTRSHRPTSRISGTGFNGQSIDLDLPPPPSPPCTCGKNLPNLPAEPQMTDLNIPSDYDAGKINFNFLSIKKHV